MSSLSWVNCLTSAYLQVTKTLTVTSLGRTLKNVWSQRTPDNDYLNLSHSKMLFVESTFFFAVSGSSKPSLFWMQKAKQTYRQLVFLFSYNLFYPGPSLYICKHQHLPP